MLPPDLPPRERDEVEREERALVPELRLAELFGFAAVERPLLDFPADDPDLEEEEEERPLLPFELLDEPLPDAEPPLLDLVEPALLPLDEAPASADHLPLITRLAASVTASAINEPSLVALESTDFAALSAVSAASIPASRIAFLAFGLALMAAAAAARPAASISLLIAALASFSVALLEPADDLELDPEDLEPEPEDFVVEFDLAFAPEDLDPVLLLDLAISNLPFSRQNRHMNGTTVPLRVRKGAGFGRIATREYRIPDTLKGTAARCSDPLEHGQRPEVIWPSVQRLRPTNTPFRPAC